MQGSAYQFLCLRYSDKRSINCEKCNGLTGRPPWHTKQLPALVRFIIRVIHKPTTPTSVSIRHLHTVSFSSDPFYSVEPRIPRPAHVQNLKTVIACTRPITVKPSLRDAVYLCFSNTFMFGKAKDMSGLIILGLLVFCNLLHRNSEYMDIVRGISR